MLPHSNPDLHPLIRELESIARRCERLHGLVHECPRHRTQQRTTQCDSTVHPFVVERGSRVTGYMSAATFWIINHGVAETEQDMEALILGAASMSSEPVSFLLPSRQASFFAGAWPRG